MKNKYKWLWIVGLMVIIATYALILLLGQHKGLDFVKSRLNFIGEDHINIISKSNTNKVLEKEVGISYDFKNEQSYLIENNDNKFVVLEYKDDIVATNDKSSFVDYIQNKSKSNNINVPSFSDFSKLKDEINTLKSKINQVTNLTKNFDFNANSNYVILKLKGSVDTLDKIVRLLH